MKFSLKTKVYLLVLVMTFVIAVSTIFTSYQIYARTMDEHYHTLAMNLAKTAASMLDTEDVTTLTDSVMGAYRDSLVDGKAPDFDAFSDAEWESYLAAFEGAQGTEAYQRLYADLATLKEKNDVLWMYICYMDAPTGKAVYIIDADVPGEANPSGYCDPIEEGNLALMMQGSYDFPAYITNYEEYGWLCSASAAITGADGQVIANAYVDISMNDVMQDRQNFLRDLALIVLVLGAALMAGIAWVVNRGMVKPINQLASAADRFISEKQENDGESAISQLNIKTGDEIENLSNSVKKMEQELNAYIADLTRVTGERERIGAELDVAKNIQASMLPYIFPPYPQHTEFDIFATMDPAKEVGGDFYDFFLVDDNHLALVMADVSGKGVPAAMFMVIAKTLLKNSAQTGMDVKSIFEKVNDQLCENNDAEMFVTTWMGILEISTGKMVCANAGHEYPAIRRKDGQFELYKDRHGFVLAGMPGARYRTYELELDKGDMLFVYTDGVAEATNANSELFGTERMLAALNKPFTSCQELLRNVRADIDEFVGDAPQFDDITMLGFEMRPIKEEDNPMQMVTITPEIASMERATAFIEEILEGHDAPIKVVSQVNVVVDEIFSNIVNYSGASISTLGCQVEGTTLTLRFADNGKPYDPTKKDDPDVTLPLEAREIGGLGIFLVKKIMDEVAYEFTDGQNVLTMKKTW